MRGRDVFDQRGDISALAEHLRNFILTGCERGISYGSGGMCQSPRGNNKSTTQTTPPWISMPSVLPRPGDPASTRSRRGIRIGSVISGKAHYSKIHISREEAHSTTLMPRQPKGAPYVSYVIGVSYVMRDTSCPFRYGVPRCRSFDRPLLHLALPISQSQLSTRFFLFVFANHACPQVSQIRSGN